MSKKSDDSIERIFRQVLTQYESTFQESDWVKMEKLLDEEANRKAAARSKRIKGTAYTLTGLTGLIIAVYFLAFKNPSGSIAELNKSVNEVQATGDLEKKGNVKLEDPSDGLLSDNETPNAVGVLPEKQEPESRAGISKGTSDTGREDNQENKSTRKRTVTPRSPDADQGTNEQKRVSSASETDDKPALERAQSPSPSSPTGIGPQENQAITVKTGDNSAPSADQKTVGQENQSVAGNSPDPAGQSTNDPDKIIPETIAASALAGNSQQGERSAAMPPTEKNGVVVQDSVPKSNTLSVRADSLENSQPKQEEKRKHVRPPYRWSVGAIVAPEYSTTNLGEYSAPGLSLGLRIGYQISNKFNISTGIIRSMKKYEGDGYDYSPRNPSYWQIRTNGMIPEEIDSKCLVYELPLGVQFDAIQTPKSRLFVSAEISSYFMISQAYDYTFDAPNPGADTGWRSAGSESYWFDIGMISTGYERYVQRSFAIGIEPYVKVSFGEIGWPNVKLFSAGAYVTLRYRFMNQKHFQ